MGANQPKFNSAALQSALRQGKSRLGIRRGEKKNATEKKKKEIKAHLESSNEMMALIHVIQQPKELYLG